MEPERTYTLEEISRKVELPCVIRVTEGYYSDTGDVESISAGDVIKIDQSVTLHKVAANFADDGDLAFGAKAGPDPDYIDLTKEEILVPLKYKGKLQVINNIKQYTEVKTLCDDFPRYAKLKKNLTVLTEDKRRVEIQAGTIIELDRIVPRPEGARVVIQFDHEGKRRAVGVPLTDRGQFRTEPDGNHYTLEEFVNRYKLPQIVRFLDDEIKRIYTTDLMEGIENMHTITETLRLNRLETQTVLIGHYSPIDSVAQDSDRFCQRTLVVLPLNVRDIRDIEAEILDSGDSDYEAMMFRNVSNSSEVLDNMIYVDFKKTPGPKVLGIKTEPVRTDEPPARPPKPGKISPSKAVSNVQFNPGGGKTDEPPARPPKPGPISVSSTSKTAGPTSPKSEKPTTAPKPKHNLAAASDLNGKETKKPSTKAEPKQKTPAPDVDNDYIRMSKTFGGSKLKTKDVTDNRDGYEVPQNRKLPRSWKPSVMTPPSKSIPEDTGDYVEPENQIYYTAFAPPQQKSPGKPAQNPSTSSAPKDTDDQDDYEIPENPDSLPQPKFPAAYNNFTYKSSSKEAETPYMGFSFADIQFSADSSVPADFPGLPVQKKGTSTLERLVKGFKNKKNKPKSQSATSPTSPRNLQIPPTSPRDIPTHMEDIGSDTEQDDAYYEDLDESQMLPLPPSNTNKLSPKAPTAIRPVAHVTPQTQRKNPSDKSSLKPFEELGVAELVKRLHIAGLDKFAGYCEDQKLDGGFFKVYGSRRADLQKEPFMLSAMDAMKFERMITTNWLPR